MLFQNVLQSIALACMASSALASPVAHLHHLHKREVVHVTETVIVTVGAATVDTTPTTAATESTTLAQDVTSGTATDFIYTLATPSPSSTESSSTEESTSTSSTAAAATSSSSSSSSGSFTAGSKGITYSPYNDDGTCKDLSSVTSDLAKLSDYELIRLYGVDCNQVENVLQAKGSNQKLFLGIFYVSDIAGGVKTIASAIESYGSWDDVYTVSVGNELVNNGEATASQIGDYISTAQSALSSAGYSGPVVSVDTHVAIINNPELCEYSDYIAFNAHAYWDGGVTGDEAGAWLLLQMQRVSTACNKNVLCVESGWPHEGSTYGVAVASSSEQSAAISSIESTCGDATIVFNAFDDLWKDAGSYGVEKYWGIY